jgi:hypothetical protein
MDRTGLRRVAVEFGVVVLGVAVALAAESWRQGLGDRRDESEYVARMIDELERGLPDIEYHLSSVAVALRAQDSLVSAGGEIEDERELAALIVQSAGYGFVAESIDLDQTYEEMLSTGSLRLIQSSDVRAEIASYFRVADRAGGVATAIRDESQREWVRRVHGEIGADWAGPATPLDEAAVERLMGLLDAGDWESSVRRSSVDLAILHLWLGRLVEGTRRVLSVLRDA